MCSWSWLYWLTHSDNLLANNRFNVLGVDVVEETVEIVNRGGIHIIEKDLEKYVKKAVENGSLVASTKPDVADVFIIAVPLLLKIILNQI